MMKRPTEKDTKKVIMEYLAEVEKELAAKKEGKFNPEEVRKAEHKKEVAVKAEAVVERGILNQEILDEYNGLKEDIENKKIDLKNLYGIDVKAETLAALIESHNIELETFKAAKDALIAEKQAELDKLQTQHDEKKAALDKQYKEDKAEVDKQLQRDKDDAKYELAKTKKTENDAWEDTKKVRVAELTAKEADVTARETAVSGKEEEIATLKAEVEALPQKIIIATKKAQEDAEKKMTTILEEKKTALEKEVELDKKLLEQELETIKKQIGVERENNKTLTEKLDAAYRQINELAIKVAQSNQTVVQGNNR